MKNSFRLRQCNSLVQMTRRNGNVYGIGNASVCTQHGLSTWYFINIKLVNTAAYQLTGTISVSCDHIVHFSGNARITGWQPALGVESDGFDYLDLTWSVRMNTAVDRRGCVWDIVVCIVGRFWQSWSSRSKSPPSHSFNTWENDLRWPHSVYSTTMDTAPFLI